MPYLALLARLYYGIQATSCQADRNVSAVAHLIGDLRYSRLARKVERIACIRLNRHKVKEVRELDAANARVRARAAKAAQKTEAALEKRANVVDAVAAQWIPRVVVVYSIRENYR